MSEKINPKKIMVIEDNQLNQKIAAMIINQLGHNVVQVFEAPKANDSIAAEMPDLIILDIKMPDGSGVDICKFVKASPQLKHIPVIVVTALSNEEEKAQIVAESGCDNYIAKPFMPHMFAEAIGRYIHIKSVDWGM